ncbi:MAG TPA: IPT/TIG domain-containing protein [Acidobacteriaceae bacterium]|nr:IPT/TIG domain-containing protein [Acidobacteriaceae bacterium]
MRHDARSVGTRSMSDTGSDGLVLLALALLFALPLAHAGGPRWVAGSSYFNASAKGQPLVWANGQVTYFTDLGNLSAKVSQTQANAMVATAAAVWSNVSTAAVSIQRGGSLAEDVNGSNIVVGATGVTAPADIESTATGTPVAVIYDADGSVINAIYGAGASSALVCQNDGVLVSVDNLAVTGNIVHALILVNGLCATTTTQITNLQFQLVRAFGQVLGLDWSQANEEMFAAGTFSTGGLAGWPLMHPVERLCNGGSGQCFSNPTQLRTDDIASLNRLYPVTAENVAGFSGKTMTASATISVQGTIQFPSGQGMQGVNVVLQPLTNGLPNLSYTATAVSGVYFQGDAGNPVTGTLDSSGNPLNRFGSDDQSLEGFFDLSGIPLPPGSTSAQYQLTFEPLNPLYIGSSSVGPYTRGQVTPSGTMPVIQLGTLSAGSAVTENVVVDDADWGESGNDGTAAAPATVPVTGVWTGRITDYAHSGWFQWWARGGREFTVEAEALDESGNPSDNKAQVVIGAWNGTDAVGTAPVTGTIQPFNGDVAGLTTLPVLTIADSEVRIGLADLRGDGRPDYAYRARVLYADSVTPARLPAAGGSMVIQGMGFETGMTVSVNGVAAQVIGVTPTTIVATAPPSGGATGTAIVQVQDSQTLGVAAIASGVSYDAEPDDAISILAAPAGTVPIGVPQPFTVRAINVTSQTPAAGVTVTFALTEGAAALGCGQNSCSVVTAGDGTATLFITPTLAALAQVTASLANASSVISEFSGATPPSIAALTPSLYVALGATVQWPVQAMVLNSSGAPLCGQGVSWTAASGIRPSAGQNVSGADGVVNNQLTAGPFNTSANVTASACPAGTGNCATFTVTPVHPETAALSTWSGTAQYVPAGQAFVPVVLRVTDQFGHPLAGAAVTFAETFFGWTEPCPIQGGCPPAPVLGEQIVQATSGVDGSVTLAPLSGNGLAGRLMVTAATGSVTLSFELDQHP